MLVVEEGLGVALGARRGVAPGVGPFHAVAHLEVVQVRRVRWGL